MFCVKDGSYSREGSVRTQCFGKMNPTELSEGQLREQLGRGLRPGMYICRVADSIKFLKSTQAFADLVVTDPPYAFNTYEDVRGMQQLYGDLVPTLVRSLNPMGQLLMAIPSLARNGKRIPYHQTRDSVVRQIIGSVEAQGRRLMRYVETIPQRKELFEAPWYWGSMSTIERRIIHFMVQ